MFAENDRSAPLQDPPLHKTVDPGRHDPLDEDDRAALEAIGKTQAFHRKFNFWSALGFTVCISGTWEGIVAAFLQGLALGGPVGLLYGYILTAIAMTCVAAVIAELASMWPSSGAQYHWIAELSPPRQRPILSWLGGWLSYCYAWLATASCAMGVAVQVQAYVTLGRSSYEPQRWHAYIIYAFVIIVYTLLNIFGVKLLHSLNLLGIGTHLGGYLLTVIIMLVYTKDKHNADYVFTTFLNSSGWSSNGVAFCTGLSTSMFGFGGLETAAHFSEEIQHVRKSVPRAIFWTALINAIITFPWLIALLYCSGNIEDVINSKIGPVSPVTQVHHPHPLPNADSTNQPPKIFFNSTNNAGLAIFLAALSTYLAFVGGIDAQGSCARTLWAMARDGAFPRWLRHVHPSLDVPVASVVVSAAPQLVIGAIYIGNTTAFYGLISGVLALYMLSYGLVVALHIHAKLSRHRTLAYGPWRLPTALGLPLNVVAFAWTVFTGVFLCFPLYQPTSAENM
ncbi:hypothetical protein SLS57_008938 [Botryosphaeria dothidea]